jgi:hypothetical protein
MNRKHRLSRRIKPIRFCLTDFFRRFNNVTSLSSGLKKVTQQVPVDIRRRRFADSSDFEASTVAERPQKVFIMSSDLQNFFHNTWHRVVPGNNNTWQATCGSLSKYFLRVFSFGSLRELLVALMADLQALARRSAIRASY